MKYITYSLLLMLSIFSLQSCLKEEENIFGQSSAERLIQAAKDYEELLSSAENGWVMDYFAETEANKMGGYQILCQFNKGKVTMAGAFTLANKYSEPGKKYSSSYSLKSSQGPVLSFNTYNNVLHGFADPGSFLNPDGFLGDYEFIIISASKEKIEMRGMKNNLKIVMRPIEKGIDWSAYCQDVLDMQEKIKNVTRFAVEKSGQSIGYVTLRTSDNEIHDTESEEIQVQKYTVSNNGINIYNPLDIEGNVLEQLAWDEENKKFTDYDSTSGVEMKSINISFDQLLGTYIVTSDNEDDPITVTFKANGKNKIRVSKEWLGYEFDIDVYENNKLGINAQSLGRDPETGYYIKLAVAARTDWLIQETTALTYDYDYSGSWYRGTVNNPELRFLTSAHTLLFLTTYTFGIRVVEYSEDTQDAKKIVGYKTLIISNPIFKKQ